MKVERNFFLNIMKNIDSFALYKIAVNAEFEIIVILTEMNSYNKNELWSTSNQNYLYS